MWLKENGFKKSLIYSSISFFPLVLFSVPSLLIDSKGFFYSIIVVGLLAVIDLLRHIDTNVVKIRKLLLMVLLMMLLLCSSLFVNSFDYLATYLLMGIPFSIILANYFNQMKRTWLAEIIFLGLLITLFLSYFS